MGQVIYMQEYLRARLAGKTAPTTPRPRDRGREKISRTAASHLSKELRRLLE